LTRMNAERKRTTKDTKGGGRNWERRDEPLIQPSHTTADKLDADERGKKDNHEIHERARKGEKQTQQDFRMGTSFIGLFSHTVIPDDDRS